MGGAHNIIFSSAAGSTLTATATYTTFPVNFLVVGGGGGGYFDVVCNPRGAAGGGGGAGQCVSGNGGSGTVIIAVPTPRYPGVLAPGATVSTPPSAPGYTVLTYTTPSPSTPAVFTYIA